MHRRRIARGCRHVRTNTLKDKQAPQIDLAPILQLSFKVCIAFRDQWRADVFRVFWRQSEFFKLVDFWSVTDSDSDHCVNQIRRRQINDKLPAFPDQRMTMVLIPDVAANQCGLESEHHVPTKRHDVALRFVRRTDQLDGTRFKEATNLFQREPMFLVLVHFAKSLIDNASFPI